MTGAGRTAGGFGSLRRKKNPKVAGENERPKHAFYRLASNAVSKAGQHVHWMNLFVVHFQDLGG